MLFNVKSNFGLVLMSRGARLVFAFSNAAILGFLLGVAQDSWGLTEWQTLLLGDVVLAVWLVAFLPWFMEGEGWIAIWRKGKKRAADQV